MVLTSDGLYTQIHVAEMRATRGGVSEGRGTVNPQDSWERPRLPRSSRGQQVWILKNNKRRPLGKGWGFEVRICRFFWSPFRQNRIATKLIESLKEQWIKLIISTCRLNIGWNMISTNNHAILCYFHRICTVSDQSPHYLGNIKTILFLFYLLVLENNFI